MYILKKILAVQRRGLRIFLKKSAVYLHPVFSHLAVRYKQIVCAGGNLSERLLSVYRRGIETNRTKIIIAIGVVSISLVGVLIFTVDLQPKIGGNFFFSSDDPQFKQDKEIAETFYQSDQVIVSVRGDIHSQEYIHRIDSLSQALKAIPETLNVQSITHGPASPQNAFESELWRRILVSDDQKATNILVFVEGVPPEELIPKIEMIQDRYSEDGFDIMMSGPPYVTELIRRNLMRDLKIFSIVAFVIFGLMIFAIFRSKFILAGTLLTCITASVATLIVNDLLGMKVGVLTANLSTIVFVLTLSHIIFIIFNWQECINEKGKSEQDSAREALKVTFPASFWSGFTTFLGFLSLMFVQARPLQRLGVSGSIGTVVALIIAYLVFPWFMRAENRKVNTPLNLQDLEKYGESFFIGRHPDLVMGILITIAVCLVGIIRLDTDPSLLSYFRQGGDIYQGLEYIDRNGGSSPLKIVVSDPAGDTFNHAGMYKRLWKLQENLEQVPTVGNIISLPLIMAEAKDRIPLSFLFAWEWILDVLDNPSFGAVTKSFVTEDRRQTLVIARMKEGAREGKRIKIIEDLKDRVRENGFQVDLVGGVYLLQGKLSELVKKSVVSGITLLIFLFVIMGFFLSRSVQVTLALLISLCCIPFWLLGLLGFLNVPLDVIAAPATNIAIGMGVDAMIHMVIFVRRLYRGDMTSPKAWRHACRHLWRPIVSSMAIVATGFGIFSLSQFPPTQRFGLFVILGTLMSPVAALLILPYLSSDKGLGEFVRKWAGKILSYRQS
ncbi:MAG: MMPL family transporter [Candidatus Omnitrophica bacterium]|nr:MMPL family transporter [Candidatus Omnitrophota bacterium]